MNGFRYLANVDRIVDDVTGHQLTRAATERLLDRWQRHHDELLRSGSIEAREASRRVRSAWLDLDLARPGAWIADQAVERGIVRDLQPITLRVVTPRAGWVASPYDQISTLVKG